MMSILAVLTSDPPHSQVYSCQCTDATSPELSRHHQPSDPPFQAPESRGSTCSRAESKQCPTILLGSTYIFDLVEVLIGTNDRLGLHPVGNLLSRRGLFVSPVSDQ